MRKLFKTFSDQKIALGSPSFYLLLIFLSLLLAIAFINDYPEYKRMLDLFDIFN